MTTKDMSYTSSKTGVDVQGKTTDQDDLKRVSSYKEVRIFDEPEHIEPPTSYIDTRSPTLIAQSPRKHRASITGKKLTGRPELDKNGSAASISQQLSNLRLDSPGITPKDSAAETDMESLLQQVIQWSHDERTRLEKVHRASKTASETTLVDKSFDDSTTRPESDIALDKLDQILAKFATYSLLPRSARRQSLSNLRRGSIAKKYVRDKLNNTFTSDTDAADALAIVPHVEAVLDNSKTLSSAAGGHGTDAQSTALKDRKHWNTFKLEILRLTHTLGLRGWRRLDLSNASLMHVERLSGALTNAVYVVKPPKDVTLVQKRDSEGNMIGSGKPARELLLRIYGPQVEHLIDRESELMILRRLAAKNIGPKLLGYFSNGRFEEFLHAKTLTALDIREPSTSKQIAKRCRELHEGIDLLESERSRGPFVFTNWDNWVERVEKVITFLDQQVKLELEGKTPASKRYTRRGLVCGAEWKIFKKAYNDYRKRLVSQYGGNSALKKRLVFAHNDTQYGNLMRLEPPAESPLLHPVNEHKQLVVIDFEYANANVPGLEFANHFTEWCYDYHVEDTSYTCNTKRYPTPEEQRRFIRSYVMHRPQFIASASATPLFEGREKTNIPDFMLDARTPGGGTPVDYEAEESARDLQLDKDIQKLQEETRLWRIANSALWVAWGIVQAKVPELDEPAKKTGLSQIVDKVIHHFQPQSDPLDEDVKERYKEMKEDRPEGRVQEEAHLEGNEEEAEDNFDYLAYSQERAMFFWGDCILMGIVTEDDLPEQTRPYIKYVKY